VPDPTNPNPGADPNANPNPNPGENPNPGNPNPASPPTAWYSGIDFGDAKDTATKALEVYKTPADLLGALDWRKQIAGGDEKAQKAFERFSTISDVGKSFLEAQAKIRSGELAKPLPKDATPEQIAEWRQGNGIPEKPEDYFKGLPNGLVIGADDKPMFDAVAGKLHELNAKPEVIHALADWYYGMQDEQVEAQKVADAEGKNKLTGALKTAWGNDFAANSNVYASYIAAAPKDVQEVLTQARGPDGNFLLYNPAVVSWLTAQAREINPAGHLVPNTGAGDVQSIETEIKSIETLMRTDRKAYNADSAKQERYRQLLEARMKLQERGRAA
jgi:hypothetical protein